MLAKDGIVVWSRKTSGIGNGKGLPKKPANIGRRDQVRLTCGRAVGFSTAGKIPSSVDKSFATACEVLE